MQVLHLFYNKYFCYSIISHVVLFVLNLLILAPAATGMITSVTFCVARGTFLLLFNPVLFFFFFLYTAVVVVLQASYMPLWCFPKKLTKKGCRLQKEQTQFCVVNMLMGR